MKESKGRAGKLRYAVRTSAYGPGRGPREEAKGPAGRNTGQKLSTCEE